MTEKKIPDQRHEKTTARLLALCLADAAAVLDAKSGRYSRAAGALFLLSGYFFNASAFFFGAFLALAALVLFSYRAYRQTPSLKRAALLLEKRFGGGSGKWLAAYELENETVFSGSTELARQAIASAAAEMTALESLPRRERGNAALGREENRLLDRLEKAADLVAIAGLLCLTAAVVLPSNSPRQQRPINTVVQERTGAASASAPQLRVEETSDSKSPEGPENPPSQDDLYASLEALRAVISRIADLYDELKAEPVEEEVFAAEKIAKEIERYIAAPNEGALALSEQTADIAVKTFPQAGIGRASGRETASGILARYLRSGAFLTNVEARRRSLVDALGILARSDRAKEKRAARETIERVCETEAAELRGAAKTLGLLARSWEFGKKLDELEAERAKLHADAVDALTRRPGRYPWETPRRDPLFEAFAARVDAVEKILTALEIQAAETGKEFSDPENKAFIEFIENIARKTETYSVIFESDLSGKGARALATYRALCSRIRSDASYERWSLAASASSERFDALTTQTVESSEPSVPGVEAAAALTWGVELVSRDLDQDIADALTSLEAPTSERTIQADADGGPGETNPLSPESSKLGADAAIEGSSPLSASTDEKFQKPRESATGKLFDIGASPDASFAGGGSGTDESVERELGPDAFISRDPQRQSERFRTAQTWTPGAEEEAKARRYQDKINEALRVRKMNNKRSQP